MSDGVPHEAAEQRPDGEIGVYCPHCGDWHGLDVTDPSELEPHPSVPEDEPLTAVCHNCNGSFRIEVPN